MFVLSIMSKITKAKRKLFLIKKKLLLHRQSRKILNKSLRIGYGLIPKEENSLLRYITKDSTVSVLENMTEATLNFLE